MDTECGMESNLLLLPKHVIRSSSYSFIDVPNWVHSDFLLEGS